MSIIRRVDWGVPQKSGCFICPYQKKRQWIELKKNHKDMWNIAVEVERNCMERYPKMSFYTDMTLDEFVSDMDKQEHLDFGEVLDQKCECYFD